MPRTAILLQGGAMKAVFGAGVLYEFGKNGLQAETISAISAGAPTAAYYTARQFEELRLIWLHELATSRFLRYDNLLLGRPIFDIEYLVDEVFRTKYPLSVEALVSSETEFKMPLYNYREGSLETHTSRQKDFAEEVWALLHLGLTVHDAHILRGTKFENYVDGSLDPFALYREIVIPEGVRPIVIWNESIIAMNPVKWLGVRLFLYLQARGFPPEIQKMLKERPKLFAEGMKLYKRFCQERNPIIVKPQKLPFSDSLDIVRRSGRHLERMFEHGREQARGALAILKNG